MYSTTTIDEMVTVLVIRLLLRVGVLHLHRSGGIITNEAVPFSMYARAVSSTFVSDDSSFIVLQLAKSSHISSMSKLKEIS